LRKAIQDASNIVTCQICHRNAFGDDERKDWRHLCDYKYKPLKYCCDYPIHELYLDWEYWLCDNCLEDIKNGNVFKIV
jgi:hypothetical protein